MAIRLTTRAYAKINLGLRILGRREDGYHDIETVFHRVNAHDEIGFEQSREILFTVNSPEVPTDDTNLCIQAARLLKETHDVKSGVHIHLKKGIPVGSGMGGGSADAAATLLSLSKLWKVRAASSELRQLALRLGSDVPYFLGDGSAYATGRGEQLEYMNLDLPYWIVVACPGIAVSTAWAYGAVRLPVRSIGSSLRELLMHHVDDVQMLKKEMQNDFEPLVLKTYPQIEEAKRSLSAVGAQMSLMSGSGSSVFGLFPTQSAARNAARELKMKYKVFVTPPHFKPVSE